MNDNYTSLKDTATYFNVSISTLRAWIKQGMPAHRVGHKLWKCVRSEVENWLSIKRV